MWYSSNRTSREVGEGYGRGEVVYAVVRRLASSLEIVLFAILAVLSLSLSLTLSLTYSLTRGSSYNDTLPQDGRQPGRSVRISHLYEPLAAFRLRSSEESLRHRRYYILSLRLFWKGWDKMKHPTRCCPRSPG